MSDIQNAATADTADPTVDFQPGTLNALLVPAVSAAAPNPPHMDAIAPGANQPVTIVFAPNTFPGILPRPEISPC
jgi:hypothetical protein